MVIRQLQNEVNYYMMTKIGLCTIDKTVASYQDLRYFCQSATSQGQVCVSGSLESEQILEFTGATQIVFTHGCYLTRLSLLLFHHIPKLPFEADLVNLEVSMFGFIIQRHCLICQRQFPTPSQFLDGIRASCVCRELPEPQLRNQTPSSVQ